MAVHILRLGSPRLQGEGLRIGTVRRPPRGVKKEDFARLNYYDIWFPNLAPTEALMKEGQSAEDEKSWLLFVKKFNAELKAPDKARELDLLAALSHHSHFSLGCYCENEARCHRSVLRQQLQARGANIR